VSSAEPRGVIGISDDYKLLVTQRLEENEHTQERFFRYWERRTHMLGCPARVIARVG
jgi:hypothetical protein